jgi:hypothetical protein
VELEEEADGVVVVEQEIGGGVEAGGDPGAELDFGGEAGLGEGLPAGCGGVAAAAEVVEIEVLLSNDPAR